MANYYASCRSNYFKVKDVDAFKKAMQRLPDIEIHEKDDSLAIFGNSQDGAGWPTYVCDPDGDDFIEFELASEVSKHLLDDEVAVLFEVGAEKLRYIIGFAEAVNSKGEIKRVSLDDIYELAGELGKNVTEAQY